MEPLTITPIGVWHTPFTDPESAPMQGRDAGQQGTIELTPEWVEGLTGVEPGGHIWVFSFFARAKPPQTIIRPGRDPNNPRTGLFNTRSPNRPVPIGFSLVEVVSINGNRITVKGIDALDGTPVLDLKPYIPRLDAPTDRQRET